MYTRYKRHFEGRRYDSRNTAESPLPYYYRSLDCTTNQIQLPKVLCSNNKLKIELYTLDLDTAPEHIELSYTGGEPEPACPEATKIPRDTWLCWNNLHECMQRLQNEDYSATIAKSILALLKLRDPVMHIVKLYRNVELSKMGRLST